VDLFAGDAAVGQQAADRISMAFGASPASGRINKKRNGAFSHYLIAQSIGKLMLQCLSLWFKITLFCKC
jgi:hypothetical protein